MKLKAAAENQTPMGLKMKSLDFMVTLGDETLTMRDATAKCIYEKHGVAVPESLAHVVVTNQVVPGIGGGVPNHAVFIQRQPVARILAQPLEPGTQQSRPIGFLIHASRNRGGLGHSARHQTVNASPSDVGRGGGAAEPMLSAMNRVKRLRTD